MKIKDYWRLAKISLNARKKATKSTVRGIAFSLIIIVPLVFAMLGLNQSITKKLNDSPGQLYVNFYSAEAGNDMVESKAYSEDSWHVNAIGNSYNDKAYGDHSKALESCGVDMLHYSVHYKASYNYNNDGRLLEKIVLDDTKYELNYNNLSPNKKPDDAGSGMPQLSTMCVVKSDIKHANSVLSKQFVEGADAGFTGNGKKQVIVNERYLKLAKLTKDDVYGKNMGVYFRDSGGNMTANITGKEESVSQISHHLFQDFEVVGVLQDSKFPIDDVRNCDLIVTGASYYDSDGNAVLAPVMIRTNEGYDAYNYGNYIVKDALTTEFVFPGGSMYGVNQLAQKYSNDGKNLSKAFEKNVYLYSNDDYKTLEKVIKSLEPEYAKIYEGFDGMMIQDMSSPVFSNYQMLSNIFGYASLFGGIIAGVILFAALINLFNSVKHSVDSRRHYLGVMKAIGAKDSTIPKLYFFEVFRILLRAFMWILVVGSIICIGLIFLIKSLSSHLPFAFVLSWVNIPIVMGALLALLVVIGLIYSLTCSYSLSKKPITTLLED